MAISKYKLMFLHFHSLEKGVNILNSIENEKQLIFINSFMSHSPILRKNVFLIQREYIYIYSLFLLVVVFKNLYRKQ